MTPRGRVLARDRLAQAWRSPRGRVLVVAVTKRLRGRVEDPWVGVEVGESLGEVDRALRTVQRKVETRHLADDRLGERLGLAGKTPVQGPPRSHGAASDFVGILVSGISPLQA